MAQGSKGTCPKKMRMPSRSHFACYDLALKLAVLLPHYVELQYEGSFKGPRFKGREDLTYGGTGKA